MNLLELLNILKPKPPEPKLPEHYGQHDVQGCMDCAIYDLYH